VTKKEKPTKMNTPFQPHDQNLTQTTKMNTIRPFTYIIYDRI